VGSEGELGVGGGDDVGVVACRNDGGSAFVGGLLEELDHAAGDSVEVGSGLVGDENARAPLVPGLPYPCRTRRGRRQVWLSALARPSRLALESRKCLL
jgi:hypothetical protein